MKRPIRHLTELGRVRVSIAVLASVAAIVALVVPATTSGALDGFESGDGNLAVESTVDWNSFTSATVANDWNFHRTTDAVGNPDNIYSGGVKQDQDCPSTKSGSLGSGSGKIDLTRIYLATQRVNDEDFLFVAWGRVDGSDAASSHVAYEFNRGTSSCGSGSDLVHRVAGDVLVVYDFSGGDADATFKVLRWITPSDPGTTGLCEVANHSKPCWGDKLDVTGTNADGDVNAGTSVNDAIAGDTLGPVQFGEAGLNLTSVGIDACDLQGTVTGVSRSSGDSGTAQMKDKVGPRAFTIPDCVKETRVTTKQLIGDTASVVDEDGATTSGTVRFQLFRELDCSGALVFDKTVTVTSGTASTAFASAPNTTPTAAVAYAADSGDYGWKVTFTPADTNAFNGSVSDCEENVQVDNGTVTP